MAKGHAIPVFVCNGVRAVLGNGQGPRNASGQHVLYQVFFGDGLGYTVKSTKLFNSELPHLS